MPRVTQHGAEAVIVDDAAALHVTQHGAEVVAIPSTPVPLRVTQHAAEPVVLFDPAPLRVTATCLDIVIKVIPDPIPPPELPTLQGCDLLLEVFNDDRETVRWSAATRLEYSNPFLVMPDRYAEQELDVATGSASLGTVTCTVVDKQLDLGDQGSGFMTSKLAHDALADLHGRRARLLRAIGTAGVDQILEVVIDGVAGTPRMDASYAAFGFEIRDTREVERKIRCFDGSSPGSLVFLPTTAAGLQGASEGYGYDEDTATWLLDPVTVGLTGTVDQNTTDFPNATTISVDLTGNPEALRTVALSVYRSWDGQSAEQGPTLPAFPTSTLWERIRFPNLAVLWREAASSDPWSVIDGAHLVIDIQASYRRYNPGVVTEDHPGELVEIERLAFGDDRIGPGGGSAYHVSSLSPPAYDPPLEGAALPADGQSIELMLVSWGPPSSTQPVHVDNITAGEFTQNVYDGIYSPRDEDGNIVPTGILYDEEAVLAMTDPVRLRLMEPIKDARDWLEKYIYAPTGWIPALDIYGRISPVSQEAPQDIFSLLLIHDAITEPAPMWDSGERIVNDVRFIHYRDYRPEDPDNAETLDGLSVAKSANSPGQILEFLDPVSLQRHGPQALELDGRAFRAVGNAGGFPALAGGAPAETGYVLGFERRDHVLNRYSLGAPTMTVNVRRAYTPNMRAGEWVRVWLSWFPDYVTGERGLLALCQVVAIGDLDCVWRQVTMEQVTPLTLYDVDDDLRIALLTGNTMKILTGNTGLPIIANL